MADVGSFLKVDDHLGDAGGVVGDSLQVPGGAHQVKPGVEMVGLLAEPLLEFFPNSAILSVDGPFFRDDRASSLRVALAERFVA